MTEVPTITGGTDSEIFTDLCPDTDGEICGTEVLIVDPESGRAVPEGADGEIWVKGPEMLLGYTRESDNQAAFSADGYFKTGDLGHFVGAKHLVITGRKKDLIIRSGKNISPKEIEDALGEDTRIADVAVVSVPSKRRCEAVCACVVLKAGASLSLADIAAFMNERGWAKQKIPEALLVLEALPRTATGKIRKDELRVQASAAALTN